MLPAHASGHLTNLKWVPRISIPLLVVSLVAAGCSSTAPRGSRPKLSDAGEQANKPEKEQEAIRAPHDWFEEATDEDDDDVVVAGAPLGPGYDPVDRGAPGSRYGEDDSGWVSSRDRGGGSGWFLAPAISPRAPWTVIRRPGCSSDFREAVSQPICADLSACPIWMKRAKSRR